MRRSVRTCFIVLALSTSSYATPPAATPEAPRLRPPTPAARQARLYEIVDDFYMADTASKMRAAVHAARKIDPDAALYHEIAAELARLDGDEPAQWDHLFQAVLDPADDSTDLHIKLFADAPEHFGGENRKLAILDLLRRAHPDSATRAQAAYSLGRSTYLRGDGPATKQAWEDTGLHLRPAIIGPFDNNQGKGFDSILPPEREIDFKARYPGSITEVGWRTELPPRIHGDDVDFSQLLYPDTWVVAYAAAGIKLQKAGEYELRLRCSTALKVFVNGALVFQAPSVKRASFDQFIIPVRLRAGLNRVLIKTAQAKGAWTLLARVTAPGGAVPNGVELAPADLPAGDEEHKGKPISSEQLMANRLAALPKATRERRLALQQQWTHALGAPKLEVQFAEQWSKAHPQSILAKYALAQALWAQQERARTADLLEELDKRAGEDFLHLRLQHARFLRQEKLRREALALLNQAKRSHPDKPALWLALADQYEAEGWTLERCQALEQAERLSVRTLQLMEKLARCYSKIKYKTKAQALFSAIVKQNPNNPDILHLLYQAAMDGNNLVEAERLAKLETEAAPHLYWTWMNLGYVYRDLGNRAAAEESYQRALGLNPDLPKLWNLMAEVAFTQGDRKAALERWQNALLHNPSNEFLANRLEELDPVKEEPWQDDIPSDDDIKKILEQRRGLVPARGADVITLLDHCVTRIYPDGSSRNVDTLIRGAVNDTGRDLLTDIALDDSGRIRVLQAYVLDPKGNRTQVSSISKKKARFRGVKVGSTVVLQYRVDRPPVGWLSKHYANTWRFQGPADQTRVSQWVVWAPRETHFNEWLSKGVQRAVENKGDLVRVAWTAVDLPPIIAEPMMPPPYEVTPKLLLSTLPNWDAFVEWERALLRDALEESEELSALATRITEGASTAEEKLSRIQNYLIREVRYEQEYEEDITGVKPHPATVVAKRGYGDCKDKTVLFIALARRVGLDAHFALVRTRNRGPVYREVPLHQSNHAIVYVPPQKDLRQGRFFDPTAEHLDLSSLRRDIVGTQALVVNLQDGGFSWIDIPMQSPSANRISAEVQVVLDRDGRAHGSCTFEAEGVLGAMLRRLSTNEQKLNQGLQAKTATLFPGATSGGQQALTGLDVTKPARYSMTLDVPQLGKVDGQTLRVTLASEWFNVEKQFSLAERRYPLVLDVPAGSSSTLRIELPDKTAIEKLPAPAKIDLPCLRYERGASSDRNQVVIQQSLVTKCERISVAAYNTYRLAAQQLTRLSKEDLVLKLQ